MVQIASVGKGYYNYYGVSNRTKTEEGKVNEVWYYKDLSKEEINRNNSNSGCSNRESQGADICRNVAEQLEGIAIANRSKYSDPEVMKREVFAKYHNSDKYKNFTFEQKIALARAEIDMTMFGTVGLSEARTIAEINGKKTQNTISIADQEDREFNKKMLGQQICNVLSNNDISISLLGNSSYTFSVKGMTNELSISLNGDDSKSSDLELLKKMTDALNSNDNAKKLFSNILYDQSKRGLISSNQLTKWKLFSDFKNITSLDIRDFKQTEEGFVDFEGKNAKDIYKDALENTTKVPSEFKGVAYDYFAQLADEAMKYNLSKVKDLTLSLDFFDGKVSMPDEKKSIDISI